MLLDYFLLFSCFYAVRGKIGYFWHITDIHYDPNYTIQGKTASACLQNVRNSIDLGGNIHRSDKKQQFGAYSCDSPWSLIKSATEAMKSKHTEGIEFVLWTGDALTRNSDITPEMRLEYLTSLTKELSQTFTGQFVFPALGHEDVHVNLTSLGTLWHQWLPPEADVTFKKAGYYSIELSTAKYRIVCLNTNLWMNVDQMADNRLSHRIGSNMIDNSDDPFDQFVWFQSVLDNARNKKETIYIVGHTPPGMDDRENGVSALNEKYNAKYLKLVRQYSDIIRGQFFGHWHSDTFRVIYSDTGSPVSWIMVAPSITPSRTGGPNNPGLRLYEFDKETGQILDYKQYYLNLYEANSKGTANWLFEYSLVDYYQLEEITSNSLHDLADRLLQSNDNAFTRYYKANTVSLPDEVGKVWGCGGPLNGICALHHYCTVTRFTPDSYKTCYSSYAYALASAGPTTGPLDAALRVMLFLFYAKTLRNR